MRRLLTLATLIAFFGGSAAAEEDFSKWKPIPPSFPSTGGGGIMIGGYDPVVRGSKCFTKFTATETNGTVYRNSVEFDAVPAQGGILCTNGRWKSEDGSATGETPFRVFIKDGVKRGDPL